MRNVKISKNKKKGKNAYKESQLKLKTLRKSGREEEGGL